MKVELKIPCEVYSRIVGYLRPVQNWHQGKQQEFHDRKTFRVPDVALLEEESL
jgi:anaerobic ribonucleoside-triphosphate reductase